MTKKGYIYIFIFKNSRGCPKVSKQFCFLSSMADAVSIVQFNRKVIWKVSTVKKH